MSVPPMTPGQSSEGLRQEGVRLLQVGNTEAALQLLSQATEANPSDGVAFQYLGIARTKAGAIDGGIAALQEAARLLPLNAGIQLNLGVAQAQAGWVSEARQTLLRAQELDPSNGRIAQMLAGLPAPTPAPTPAPMGLTGVGGYDVFGDSSQTAAPAVPTPPQLGTVPGLNQPVLAPPTLAPAQNSYNPSSPYNGDIPSGLSSLPASAISARMLVREPSVSERAMRGLGWGAICAQWWTLLMFFWEIVVHGLGSGRMTAGEAVAYTVAFAIVFGIVGALMGVFMAFTRAEISTGAIIGVIVGLVFLGLEFLLYQSPGIFLNIFFWFFTGRFVGSNIAARVNATVDV